MPSLYLEAQMLFDYIRILKSKGGVLSDLSYDNQDESSLPLLDLAAADYLLIGMQYPFTNFFIDTTGGVANDQASNLILEYWNGNAWVAAVDVLDGTRVAGCSMAKSGAILFSIDKQKSGWGKVNNTRTSQMAELNTKDLYDLYWLKVRFSADLNALTSFQELGFAWTNGAKMRGIKAEVDRYFNSFKTGKTNWIPEIMAACKMMMTDLKKADIALGPQQVIRLDDFWLPATYKTLWLIYNNLGPAYLETANGFAHQYHKTFAPQNLVIDENANGTIDQVEAKGRVQTGVR